MTLCLFLPSGKTFTFQSAEITTNNESVLVASYIAMSDGKVKVLTAQKSQIVGWSESTMPARTK